MLKKQIELALFHSDSGLLFVGLILLPLLVATACGRLLNVHGVAFQIFIGVSFPLCLLIGFIAAKWRSSVVEQMQRESLEQAANIDINTSQSEEQRFDRHPRKLKFNRTIAGNPPAVNQAWMLFNPLVWIMLFYFFTACTIDEDLRKNAQIYPAELIKASVGDHSVQNRGNAMSVFQQRLTFEYSVAGKSYILQVDNCDEPNKYEVGKVYSVRALPNKPTVCEPFDKDSGTKQRDDAYAGALFLFVNLIIEFSIWYQPLRHKRLAQSGIPVPVRIKHMNYQMSAGNGGSITLILPSTFGVFAETLDSTDPTQYEFKLNSADYGRLKNGAIELALIDPVFKSNTVFYRFCKYQVID